MDRVYRGRYIENAVSLLQFLFYSYILQFNSATVIIFNRCIMPVTFSEGRYKYGLKKLSDSAN